jgi:hypothetical protein
MLPGSMGEYLGQFAQRVVDSKAYREDHVFGGLGP